MNRPTQGLARAIAADDGNCTKHRQSERAFHFRCVANLRIRPLAHEAQSASEQNAHQPRAGKNVVDIGPNRVEFVLSRIKNGHRQRAGIAGQNGLPDLRVQRIALRRQTLFLCLQLRVTRGRRALLDRGLLLLVKRALKFLLARD